MPRRRIDAALAAWARLTRTPPVAFALRVVERFAEVGGIERAMVIASQAFTAFIPLLVITVALVPGSDAEGFGDRVVERFDLTGAVADSVRELFAPAGDVTGSITAVGVVLLLVTAYTFSRRVQGLYQMAWRLPPASLRQAWRPLGWVVLVALYLVLLPAIRLVDPGHRLVIAAASFGLWLVTPSFLLAGRVSWRALVPTAVLTATGMTLMSAVSTIYMSRAMTEATEQFGPIGAAFAVVSWLVAVGVVIVVAAVVGAVWKEGDADRRPAPAPLGGDDAPLLRAP